MPFVPSHPCCHCHIPPILPSMIQPNKKYHKHKYSSCHAIYNLVRESERGDKSKRVPCCVRYFLLQTCGTMPKILVSDILGDSNLPSYEGSWQTKFEKEWMEGCSGTDHASDPRTHALKQYLLNPEKMDPSSPPFRKG